ncbi:hypothetical protein C3F09_01215 [candidate division GN15 bacterium]|uniref:FtsX-like permease family protein n=1 Tax=candidate division GN15 bacterium TaxID=2072418 RepID=A0A855XCR5_9BACT|nr:MAG: hypothetical protein C3F09_01215 [candidate division GN15 bacterium]
MLRNYLTVALRNIVRNKLPTGINISGLAVGMATCILIMLWVADELSFDRFHQDADCIYRLCNELSMSGTVIHTPTGGDPMAPAIQAACPEVTAITRVKTGDRTDIAYGNNRIFEDKILYADSQFFSVFTFPLSQGNPKTALARRHSVVITRDIARKYFGDEDPLGKTLRFRGDDEYTVTGVIEKVPSNSHLSFDFLASYRTLYAEEGNDMGRWGDLSIYTYMRTIPDGSVEKLESKVASVVHEHVGSKISRKEGDSLRAYLQPLTDIHLYSGTAFVQEVATRQGNVTYVFLFAGIALGVLLIACANFVNLTTARSAYRAREIGVRKTFGADHGRLIFQFLMESVLLSLAALVIALILIELALPSFNAMTERDLRIEYLAHPLLIVGFVVYAILVGLIAGIYPALSLSAMKPARGLKGDCRASESRSILRRVLVVGQYTISIALIIGTAIIYNQVHFMMNKNLGFAKEQLLVVPGFDVWPSGPAAAVMSEIAQAPGVVGVSGAWSVPGADAQMLNFLPEGPDADEILMTQIYADESYVPTLGLQVVAGRNFSREMGSDSADALIINEAAVRRFGWQGAIGKTISQRVTREGKRSWQPRKVIGVVKDFHYTDLRQTIQPVIIFPSAPSFKYLLIRIGTSEVSRTLDMIRERWNRLSRGYPIDYFFMDRRFAEQYESERRLGRIAVSFSALAIFVACLGLFGMASHEVRRRTKEIGVRKVLGATIRGVAAILASDMVKWVLLANAIAWPIAYCVMSRWMQTFAYRTSIGPGVFILAGALTLVLALATVGYHAVRAARTNPVESLKYE